MLSRSVPGYGGCTMPIVEQPTVQTCVPTLPHNGPLPLHHHSSSLCFSLTATHAATPFPITPFTLTIFSQLLLRLARAIRSRRWKRRRRRRRRDDIESLLSLYLSIYLSFSKEMSPSRGSKNDARRILDTTSSCRILHAKGDGGKPFRRFKRRL